MSHFHASPRSRPWSEVYRVPGEYVLAGEYPGHPHRAEAETKLRELLAHGIRAFIDLTQPTDGLMPYEDVLADVAASMGVTAVRHALPVPDMGVPTDDHMRTVLDTIDAELRQGHGVYVHCWGGIGRTGTAVGCLLVRRGHDGDAALAAVQQAYSATQKSRGRYPHSPQTDRQRRFVREWREPVPVVACEARVAAEAADLLAAHPPRLQHPHKVRLYERLLETPVRGRLEVTRWRSAPLPTVLPPALPRVETREGFFRYDAAEHDAREVPWHVNFADGHVFGFHHGPLLAQDELQGLEHPLLACVPEWLRAAGVPPRTIDDADVPTPILVSGVERRGHFRTALPRPDGTTANLYGNAFAAAPAALVDEALQPLEPPTMSHLIAIAARGYGHGPYTADDLAWTLRCAWTGFAAAVQESRRLAGGEARTVVHTGWWGCGAFGGNRELMVILQCLAAQLAGVTRLILHRGMDDHDDTAGRAVLDWRDGLRLAGRVPDALDALLARGYRWGRSDGN